MRWKNRCLMVLLTAACLFGMTGCSGAEKQKAADEMEQTRWKLIGEWKTEEEMYYINLLDADLVKHEIVMNFSFKHHEHEEMRVESRDMRTYPLIWKENEACWRVGNVPDEFQIDICMGQTCSIAVNSKPLIRKQAMLVH